MREVIGRPGTVPDGIGRRRILAGAAASVLGLGAAKAVDNVLAGYGVVTGTNLIEQDLSAAVAERFGPSPFRTDVDGVEVRLGGRRLSVRTPEGEAAVVDVSGTSLDAVEDVDADAGLDGQLVGLVRDLRTVEAGDVTFEFTGYPAFFERVAERGGRPLSVEALRGARFRTPDRGTVEAFTDTDPADPRRLVEGLAWGFREFSGYDVPRYLAGSVQDNVIFNAADLRAGFRSPTGFDAMLSGENTGLFCYEFTYRSVEAFHAVPAAEQTVPVIAAVVTDARHKHVYTGLAGTVRQDDRLVVPMTFVDYTHSTLYDDVGLRGVLGEGVAAYDDRHRTTDVFWNRYARW